MSSLDFLGRPMKICLAYRKKSPLRYTIKLPIHPYFYILTHFNIILGCLTTSLNKCKDKFHNKKDSRSLHFQSSLDKYFSGNINREMTDYHYFIWGNGNFAKKKEIVQAISRSEDVTYMQMT